jgi:hypothetical protein
MSEANNGRKVKTFVETEGNVEEKAEICPKLTPEDEQEGASSEHWAPISVSGADGMAEADIAFSVPKQAEPHNICIGLQI